MAKVKFCGLTRPEDARHAARLGAAYVGAIFAGGPRTVTAARALSLFEAAAGGAIGPAGEGATAVGVFGADDVRAIAASAIATGMGVIQLHGDPRAADVRAMRRRFDGHIWAVARAQGSVLPEWTEELFREADAVLLDARVEGRLGGTGVALEWSALADSVAALRGRTPVILAGGLTPENVAEAVRALAPDVVDVSSGVESSPGIKDHAKMRAFFEAAQGSTP
ncbi:MAG TPA: phosphoribosylanthranilate isomerase [Gemmatimonadaceae bacterium]